MKESIYLKALEYSSKKPHQGVTYNELKGYIEGIGNEKFTAESSLTFFQFILDTHYWSSSQIGRKPEENVGIISQFYSSFKELSKPGKIDTSGFNATFIKFTQEEKYFLNSEGDKRLLDFYELREARITARQAYRFSIVAIIISLLALLFAPALEWLWNYLLHK